MHEDQITAESRTPNALSESAHLPASYTAISRAAGEELQQLAELVTPSLEASKADDLLMTVELKRGELRPLVESWNNVVPESETGASLKERFEQYETLFNGFYASLIAVNDRARAQRADSVPDHLRLLYEVAGEFCFCGEGVLGTGDRVMGYPRDAVPGEIWTHIARYVKYLSFKLGPDTMSLSVDTVDLPPPSPVDTATNIVSGILKHGLISADYAQYLNQSALRGTDGYSDSGYQKVKPVCACFWDTAALRSEGEEPAAYISEYSCLFGPRAPLGVSVERSTDDINDFPMNIPAAEMERRLKLSAIIVLRIEGEMGSFAPRWRDVDRVMFRGMDGDSAYMCGPIPPQHIYRILIPEESAASISSKLSEEHQEKIVPVRNSVGISADYLLNTEKGIRLGSPDFQTELRRCISEALLAGARIGDGNDCVIGIHATRLGE